jgi:hypothetical protein
MRWDIRVYSVFPCCIMVALICVSSRPVSAAEWKTFNGTAGFSIMYPSDWVSNQSANFLGLVSDNRWGTTSVGLASNQAEIMVERKPPPETLESLTKTMRYGDPPGADPTLKFLLQKDFAAQSRPSSCKRLREAADNFLIVERFFSTNDPVPRLTEDSYFCEVPGAVVAIELIYWKGDKREAEYRQIALRMAQSLRVLH